MTSPLTIHNCLSSIKARRNIPSLIDQWRSLLTDLFQEKTKISLMQGEVLSSREAVLHLARLSSGEISPFISAALVCAHVWIGLTPPPTTINPSQDGALWFSCDHYHPWRLTLERVLQLETAALTLLIALKTKNTIWIEAANLLMHWESLLLDGQGFPLTRIFQPVHWIPCEALVSTCFWGAAALFQKGAWLDLARKAEACSQKDFIDSMPFWLALDSAMKSFSVPLSQGNAVSEWLCGAQGGIVGWRKDKAHIIFSLYGGKAGFGEIKCEDVHILLWGPEHGGTYFPDGFGIEGAPNSLPFPPIAQVDQQVARVEGTIRMLDPPHSVSSPIWIRLEGTIKPNELHWKGEWLTLTNPYPPVELVYLVKADECILDNRSVPITSDTYRGNASNCCFRSQKGSQIVIEVHEKAIAMQIEKISLEKQQVWKLVLVVPSDDFSFHGSIKTQLAP